MKLLHMADVHLGVQFKTLGERAESQRGQIKKTFHKALELGVKEKVDIVLISGDLFDGNHPSRDLVEFVRGEFNYLKENSTELCLVPGDHDALDEHGIYNRERFDDEFSNVFIFRNPDGEVREYQDFSTAVFSKPNLTSISTKSPFPEVAALSTAMKHKILMAHGDLQIPGKSSENYHPITYSEIEGLEGIDYVALGHWHSMKDCSEYGNFKMPVWYSGSPELVAQDQRGAGNVIVAEITDEGCSPKSVRVGKRRSSKVSLDASDFSNVEELKKKILEHADKDTILQLELAGLNTNNLIINPDHLESELQDAFFYIRVVDKSHLALQDIPDYPDNLIQGRFLKIMRKKIKDAPEGEKKTYEEALQIGLAELEGKEVV